MGGGGLGWLRVRASLGSLSKYGRFFCLHLSHAGHGPRDLLSRYCRQDAPALPGLPLPTPPSPACGSSQHPSNPELSPQARSPAPTSAALQHLEKGPWANGRGKYSFPLPCPSPSLAPQGPLIGSQPLWAGTVDCKCSGFPKSKAECSLSSLIPTSVMARRPHRLS